MRIVILNVDYPGFLRALYAEHPDLDRASYDEQMRVRNESLFGVADFYSSNLRALGHEAYDIHANNEPLQRAWAREHDLPVRSGSRERWALRLRRGIIPWISRIEDRRWIYEILAAQIERLKPDVILNQAIDGIDGTFLRAMKKHTRLLAGQIAAPISDDEDVSMYDLIVSSLPNFVERFRRLGITSEENRFAFEPRVLQMVKPGERDIPISFVGSISRHHQTRVKLLEYLCERFDLALWGKGIETLPESSILHRHHRGPAWGGEMYRILGRSMITLNHHISIAGEYANNMRLFEATGMGALLLTDWKSNLGDIFALDSEVVSYRTPEECAAHIERLLAAEHDRARIAAAGQQRTVEEHNYRRRMEELVGIMNDELCRM